MTQFGYYVAIAQCLNRTCDQLIVGRNLPYSRVTRIILSQEYLDAADLDAIRRRGNTYTNYVLFWSLLINIFYQTKNPSTRVNTFSFQTQN